MKNKRRIPYNPFEELEDFSDLKSLIRHILESLEVKEVKVRMAWGFKKDEIRNPIHLLPVPDILVGNATYSYIQHKADYVLKCVINRIEKINRDPSLSFTDKLNLYNEVRKEVAYHFQYFNTMNPVRYMSAYIWKIVYSEEENDKNVDKEEVCANSELDLKDWHWNVLENTLLIRRHLLYEILYLINVELQKIQDKISETKYMWEGKEPYELHELLIALLASKRVRIEKGDENTFAHDFLTFFGKTDSNFALSRSKVMKRVTRSQFLPILEESLEKYGKPTSKNSPK